MTKVDINGTVLSSFQHAEFVIRKSRDGERIEGFNITTNFNGTSEIKSIIDNDSTFHITMLNESDMSVIAELRNAELDHYSFNADEENATFNGQLVVN